MATQFDSPPAATVSVGRIINRAFAVIASNPAVVLGIAFLLGALPSVVVSFFSQRLQQGLLADPDRIRDVIFISIGSVLIGVMLAMIVQGALVRATVAFAEGRRASFGESLTAGLRLAFPLVLLAIIVGVCVMIGFMLIIVPGIILYLMWCVAAPVLVEERTGVFGALGRSRRLTKGARWKVFGLQLIIVVFYWLFSAVLGFAMIAANGGINHLATNVATGLPISWLIINAIIATLINTFWSTAQTSLYIELRNWKDGPENHNLEDIFA